MTNFAELKLGFEMSALVSALHKSGALHIDTFMHELSEYVLQTKTGETAHIARIDQPRAAVLDQMLSDWYGIRAALDLPPEQPLDPRGYQR